MSRVRGSIQPSSAHSRVLRSRNSAAEPVSLPPELAKPWAGGGTPRAALAARTVVQLQRAAGNQAVSRLLTATGGAVTASRALSTVQRFALEHHALNDDPTPAAPNCYTAVLTWLLRSQGKATTSEEAINLIIDKGHAGPLMARILGLARQLKRPSKRDTQLRVTPGAIVIFSANGAPSHAAVATGRLQMTGYNQTHWFGQPANKLTHSSLEGVHWVSRDEIVNHVRHRENVHEVDPATAMSVFG